MLRQNPLNPCQLLQEIPEGSGNWVVIFDLGLCNPNFIGNTFGANDATKRCNIASLLTDIILPDAVDAALSAKENLSSQGGFIGSLVGIVASFATPAGVISRTLLSASGAVTVGGLLLGSDAASVRGQIDNAYWLLLKQQLFCSMPEDGVLTPHALQGMANLYSLDNIPNKELINALVSQILRGMSRETAEYVSAFGAVYDGDNNGCDDCLLPSGLVAVYADSQLISIGTNQWKLKVDVGPYYVGAYRLPYTSNCARIRIDNVVTAPSSSNTPIVRLGRCGSSEIVFLTELEALDDQCFNSFEIFSTNAFEIDVTVIDDCADIVGQLYAEVSEGYLEALPAQPNGDFVLNSLDRLPFPEVDGYRRYFLGNTSSCYQIEKLEFSSGVTGQLPTKVKVYD